MHASTHLDAATLQRLENKGLVADIDEKAGVVALTGDGAKRSRTLFQRLFGEGDVGAEPAEAEPVADQPRTEADAPAESEVYLHDAFLDDEVRADGTLQQLVLETVERNALIEQFSSRQLKGGIYLDTSEEKVNRLGASDPAPPASDRRFLEVEPLPADEYWHDMSDFASLVRNGDLAAWVHDVIEDSETVDAFREQIDRVDGLLDAWLEFERDRARHRLDAWLAHRGYALAE